MSPRAHQLGELLRLLDEAASAQPSADEIVAACGEPAPVTPQQVRAGSGFFLLFHRLNDRLDQLELDADLEALRDEARRLLRYHQWMLRQSLQVAWSSTGRAGLRINGLGAPADRLLRLRDDVRDQVRTQHIT